MGGWRNGSRARLRLVYPQGCEGSSPSSPTLEGSPSPVYGASLLMTRGNSHASSNLAPSATEKVPGRLREGKRC